MLVILHTQRVLVRVFSYVYKQETNLKGHSNTQTL